MISITALFVMIGLLILQVNSAFTIALMIGLVDLLPYLGVGLIMVPWAAYLFMNGDLYLGIGISIIYLILLIARQIIEPKVLASSVGPRPTRHAGWHVCGFEVVRCSGLDYWPCQSRDSRCVQSG